MRNRQKSLSHYAAGLVVLAILVLALGTRLDVGKAQTASSEDLLIPVIPPGSAYRQTNLLSDVPGLAPLQDPLLINPWGISFRGTSPFWIANNGTSTSQLISGDVAGSPAVLNPGLQTITIPGGLPTGTVGNSTTSFVLPGPCAIASCPAAFIFASITGNIVGWNPNAPAAGSVTGVIAASNPGHVYTGLAIGSNGGGNRLYAADFASGTIDVYNPTFALTTTAGGFADPTIPTTAGNTFHPYNIQNIGGLLYVLYAKVGTSGLPEDGVGNGFVRRFNTDGVRDLTFGINNGPLNSPWGVTIAPATFGIFGNALLIGNFGEGNPSIHAYNPTTGAFLGTIQDQSGNGIVIEELWALQFGNGVNGGDTSSLYFTAGIGEEEHGLFGKLRPTTASATSLIQLAADEFAVGETVGHIDFTVIRVGDASSSASVNYNTFDESQPAHASQKSDYEIALGTLTFAPGETSKTFRILIVDDKFVEGNEVIGVYLSNPVGMGVGLGSPNFAEVTIVDDDLTVSATHPLDTGAFFVRQQYLDLYNREPDAAASALVSQISACGFTRSCMRTKQIDVALGIFTSPEFQGAGSLAIRTFRTAFGTGRFGGPTDVLYGEFQQSIQALLKDVAIPGGGAQLEINKQLFYDRFVARPDFVARYPSSLTNAQYVDALLSNTGTVFPPGFRDQLVADLDMMIKTRAQVVRSIAEHPTFVLNDAKRDIVQLGFFGYLRRDADTNTFNLVLNRLNAVTFDHVRDAVRMFITTTEYRQRFGSDVFPSGGLINLAPDAVNNAATTPVNTPISINVVANDTDDNGDYLSILSVTPGTGGTPVINPDGRSITFTPGPGFSGIANFQYTLTDNGTKSLGNVPIDDPKTDTATVFIGVGVPTPTVSVSGRLFTPIGAGLTKAVVVLTGPSTNRTALSSSFGNFLFTDLVVGQTYTISVSSKRFTFTPRMVPVNDYMTDVDLVASP